MLLPGFTSSIRSPKLPILFLLLGLTLAALPGPGLRADGEALPQSPRVETIRLLIPNAGRLDWAVQGDWIAFDRLGEDGFYDVHITKPDGSVERCLTCDLLELRKNHAMDPVWHPSGEFLIFEVQQNAKKLKLKAATMATPMRGVRGELWMISKDGKRFWQLTRVGRTGTAALEPHFSHEGRLIAFSQRVADSGGLWGEWALRVGTVDGARVPRLKKVRTFRPGKHRRFVRAHGFSPNDRQLLISGNLEPGQPESGMDLYLFDMTSQALTRLTRSSGDWEELGEFSPDGHSIAYTSTRNISRRRPLLQTDVPRAGRAQRRDLWIMNADGTGQERLTFFNHDAAPESERGAVVGDLAWNPGGGEVAVQVLTDLGDHEEAIYVVKLFSADD